jgi:hypothetical protein
MQICPSQIGSGRSDLVGQEFVESGRIDGQRLAASGHRENANQRHRQDNHSAHRSSPSHMLLLLRLGGDVLPIRQPSVPITGFNGPGRVLQFVPLLADNTANDEWQGAKTSRRDAAVTIGTPPVPALREEIDRSIQFELRRITPIEHGQPDLLLLGFLRHLRKVSDAFPSRTRRFQYLPAFPEEVSKRPLPPGGIARDACAWWHLGRSIGARPHLPVAPPSFGTRGHASREHWSPSRLATLVAASRFSPRGEGADGRLPNRHHVPAPGVGMISRLVSRVVAPATLFHSERSLTKPWAVGHLSLPFLLVA